NVEHLDDRGAAGAWRRHADDVVAAIGALDDATLLRLIRLEVGHRDQTAVCLHLLFDERGSVPFIESRWALIGDARQRLRKIGLLENLTRFVGLAALRELRQRCR